MELHIHNHSNNDCISSLLKQIIMNQEELKAALEAATVQAEKNKAELVVKLDELAAAIAAQGQVSPEVQAALTALNDTLKATDDLVADA
jgi:hypothetical protein